MFRDFISLGIHRKSNRFIDLVFDKLIYILANIIELGGINMAGPRIFTSFAIEDTSLRSLFTGQAKNSSVPFEFTDYSVKSAWDSSWKTNCRARIKGCRGLIGIITRNSPKADGQLWEIACAYQEGVPVLLIWGSANDKAMILPSAINNRVIYDWTWSNIENFVRKVS